MNPLVLPKSLARQIEQEGVASFPNECCGILYGHDERDRRVVTRIEPVVNEFESDEQYHRFLITPATLMKAEKTAAKNGELVLGFYHSHPDHPAIFSQYDKDHGWPFYSYVITSIMKREPAEMSCWIMDDATEQFVRQDIVPG